MFQFIQGRVLRHDQEFNNLVVLPSSGMALGIYYKTEKPLSGDVSLWLWPVFSAEKGYTFYGFQDAVARRTAELLWSKIDGLGPMGASHVCQLVPDLVQLRGMTAATLRASVKGLGKKAEEVLKVLGEQQQGPTLRDWLVQVGIGDPDSEKMRIAKEAGSTTQEQVAAYLAMR